MQATNVCRATNVLMLTTEEFQLTNPNTMKVMRVLAFNCAVFFNWMLGDSSTAFYIDPD